MDADTRDLAWVENIEDALDALEGWAVGDYLDRHPAYVERDALLRRLEVLAARLDRLVIFWSARTSLPR